MFAPAPRKWGLIPGRERAKNNPTKAFVNVLAVFATEFAIRSLRSGLCDLVSATRSHAKRFRGRLLGRRYGTS